MGVGLRGWGSGWGAAGDRMVVVSLLAGAGGGLDESSVGGATFKREVRVERGVRPRPLGFTGDVTNLCVRNKTHDSSHMVMPPL